MQVAVYFTAGQPIVGYHSEVMTKVGPRTTFVPVNDFTLSIDREAHTVTITDKLTGATRKHELYTAPVEEQGKFGSSLRRADGIWQHTSKDGSTYWLMYSPEGIGNADKAAPI